jgi:excisionase family DNA binding protein
MGTLTVTDAARQTYTVAEAARVLGVSLAVAYRHVRAGDIPAIKLGGRYLIPRDGLARLLAGESLNGEAP